MANSIIDLLLPSGRIQQGKNTHIFTPEHIAQDMIDLLPDEIWNENTTFLDICSKSGVFLRLIKKKLMSSQRLTELYPDKEERMEHIEDNQLFGICPDEKLSYIVQSEIYGYVYPSGNIKYIKEYYKLVNNKNQQLLIDTIKENFGTMKFDIVIGNPPYNKGMDLDFVYLGYNMSQLYSVFITPAKWQTAAADQGIKSKLVTYGTFREKLVPHMKKVVFFPQSQDVFDVYQIDGITYYLLGKESINETIIVNKCSLQKYFESENVRNIKHRVPLNNIGNEVVQFLGKYEKFKFPYIGYNKRYQVWINRLVTGNQLLSSDGKTLTIGIVRLLDTTTSRETGVKQSECNFCSNDKLECESFISWINSKFVRFFVAINISKLTGIICDECFRLVPAPPARYDEQGNKLPDFDHIYTDQELYQAFNLPQKYIEVIEAVIKERK